MKFHRGFAAISPGLALSPPQPAFAHADCGTLTGTATGPHGALVPAAKNPVPNPLTGAQYVTFTTTTDNYSSAQLLAGAYGPTVEARGFKRCTQHGIKVAVAQTARIDVVLEIAGANEPVTVTADAPLLKTESAGQSYHIDTGRIDALPLNSGGFELTEEALKKYPFAGSRPMSACFTRMDPLPSGRQISARSTRRRQYRRESGREDPT